MGKTEAFDSSYQWRVRSLSGVERHDSRYDRINEVIDVGALRSKRVTIVGVGRMGGPVADQLVRHGVATQSPGWMRLIDGDVVQRDNIAGSIFTERHANKPKVEALGEHLRDIDSDANVRCWNKMLTEDDLPQLVELAHESDLLGLFADDFELMLKMADHCHSICPQVMAMFGQRCDIAEVAFSVPGMTQPLRQTLGTRERHAIHSAQALGTDTLFVASFVASLCLRLLLGDAKGSELLPCYADAPLYLLGVRREWIFAHQPEDLIRSVVVVGASSDSSIPLPEGVFHADIDRSTD